MKIQLFNKDKYGNLEEVVPHIISNAYKDVFHALVKHSWGKNTRQDTITDCCFQPTNPDDFVAAFFKALQQPIIKQEGLKFLELGAAMGNNLFLAQATLDYFKLYFEPMIIQIVGIELDSRIVRVAEGFANITYGDMIDAPLGQFNIIHYFDSLGRADGKEQKLYDKLNAEMSKGSIFLSTSSKYPDKKYWYQIEKFTSSRTSIFIRNSVRYEKEQKRRNK